MTIFCLSGEPKKKKKNWPLGVAAIHPNGQGERDSATPSGHFCLSGEQKKKKDPATQTQPKKSFLMPQKSILMPQNSFIML
jgi:hypothetical protein